MSALADIDATLGDAPIAVVREITKMFEETRRGTAQEILSYYKEHGAPKGEIVIVIGEAQVAAYSEAQIDMMLRDALKTTSTKGAAADIADITGLPKKQLYTRALEIKSDE